MDPGRHAAYEDIFGRCPAPPLAHPHNRPNGRTPPTQIQIHKDTIPTRINTSARQRRRTILILIHMPTTRSNMHPNTAATRRTGSAEHTGPEPLPAVPARRPCACARPTHGRAGSDTRTGVSGTGHDVPAGAAVESPATVAFACVSAIGSTHVESGYWRRGGLGINFGFESPTAVESGGIGGGRVWEGG
ncbi:hypothetical protein B0H13DRAFT_2326976 [Mycena leptocephala]|nr:hypothetical protein B0H13DRAFT_2326976 [Mycena leptocephala]